MSDVNISATVARTVQMSSQMARAGQGEEAQATQRLSVNDQVQLSAEAKKRMEQLSEGQTIAEAYLKHLLETKALEPGKAETEQDLNDEDAKNKLGGAVEKISMDLTWLVEALGIPPEEASKLHAVLAARASLDYAQSRPPVPEIIVRARSEDALATVFVHELQFDVGKDGITGASVQQVRVTHATSSLGEQLADPNAPRVVFVGSEQEAGVQGSKAAFESNLSARLASIPNQELQGMLIVREHLMAGDTRRMRVDALMPLDKARA